MHPSRIVVLGATGLVGRRVVPLLLAQGHTVTAAGRDLARLTALARLGARTATVDLLDREAIARAVRGQDVVVNLATSVPAGARALLPGAWKPMDRIRRDGSALVAEVAIAAGVARVVQESFAGIYPDRGAEWSDESVATRPAAYNRTVLDAEASARRLTMAGRTGVALRFAFFYGGADDPFTRDALRAARRGWLPLPGDRDAYVSTVTHDDAARAVVAALDAPAGLYNVVDDEPLTRGALAQALGDALGVRAPKLPPRWVAALAGAVGETLARSIRLSNRAFREATGWAPASPSGREGWRRAAEAIGAEGGRASAA